MRDLTSVVHQRTTTSMLRHKMSSTLDEKAPGSIRAAVALKKKAPVTGELVHKPQAQARPAMTRDERWLLTSLEHTIKGVEEVPKNRVADILVHTFAGALFLLTTEREPITITPSKPTIDLSGRRAE